MPYLNHNNLQIVLTNDIGEKHTAVELKKNSDGSYTYKTIEGNLRTDFVVFAQTEIDQQSNSYSDTYIHLSPPTHQ